MYTYKDHIKFLLRKKFAPNASNASNASDAYVDKCYSICLEQKEKNPTKNISMIKIIEEVLYNDSIDTFSGSNTTHQK